MREQKLFLAGSWIDGEDALVVRSPWDGSTVARVARGGPATLERAAEIDRERHATRFARAPANVEIGDEIFAIARVREPIARAKQRPRRFQKERLGAPFQGPRASPTLAQRHRTDLRNAPK